MNKIILLLATLSLPVYAVSAPFCAVTGLGTNCGYYDVQTCQYAAGPSGACIANPDQSNGARPPVKFIDRNTTTDTIRRNQEEAAKRRAEEQEAELRQLEIEQKRHEIDRQKSEMKKQERPQLAPVPNGENDSNELPPHQDSLLTLVCDIREAGEHEQVTLTVDMLNQTVDGWPARISDKHIVWESATKNTKLHWLINRFSGMVTVDVRGSTVRGQCEALTQADRRF